MTKRRSQSENACAVVEEGCGKSRPLTVILWNSKTNSHIISCCQVAKDQLVPGCSLFDVLRSFETAVPGVSVESYRPHRRGELILI